MECQTINFRKLESHRLKAAKLLVVDDGVGKVWAIDLYAHVRATCWDDIGRNWFIVSLELWNCKVLVMVTKIAVPKLQKCWPLIMGNMLSGWCGDVESRVELHMHVCKGLG